MSDLVERLISKATDCHFSEESLYMEAAEALGHVSALWIAETREIERLRAALGTIAGSEPQNFDSAMLRAIAAGALEQKPST